MARRWQAILAVIKLVLLFNLVSSVYAQDIGSYALTPDGRVGKIATVAFQGDVVVDFFDQRLHTDHTERIKIESLSAPVPTLPMNDGTTLATGDFILLTGSDDKTFFEVTTLFENGRILATSVAGGSNAVVASRESVRSVVAHKNFLDKFIAGVDQEIAADLEVLKINTRAALNCLEKDQCQFSLSPRYRASGLEDFHFTSSSELLSLLRLQALQYRFYSGLAAGDTLNAVAKNNPNLPFIQVRAAPGMTPIVFQKGKFDEAYIREHAQLDILNGRAFMNFINDHFGVTHDDPEDLFGKSHVCNQGNCTDDSAYAVLVQPIYRLVADEINQGQPFLQFLNWRLDKDDFVHALKRTIQEARAARTFIDDLKPEDRLIELSFTEAVDARLDKLDWAQRDLVTALAQREESKSDAWTRILSEIKRPKFYAVLGCYGVSTLTPLKFAIVACHAAGLSLTLSEVFTQTTRSWRLASLERLRLLKPGVFEAAALNLVIESSVALLYVKVALPDFRAPVQFLTSRATGKSALNVAVTNGDSIVQNHRAADMAYEQVQESIEKFGLGKLLGMNPIAKSFFTSFMNPQTSADVFKKMGINIQGGLISAGAIYAILMSTPAYAQMIGVPATQMKANWLGLAQAGSAVDKKVIQTMLLGLP